VSSERNEERLPDQEQPSANLKMKPSAEEEPDKGASPDSAPDFSSQESSSQEVAPRIETVVPPSAERGADESGADAAKEDSGGAAEATQPEPNVEAKVPAKEEEVSSGPSIEELNEQVLADSRRHTRRSFVVAAAAAATGYSLYRWIERQHPVEMQPGPFRSAFDTNASISRTLFDERGLAPTYPLKRAENLRVNGVYGLKKMLAPESYRLQLVGSTASPSHPQFTQDVTSWEYRYVDEKTMESEGHATKTPPHSALTSEKMPPESMVEQEKQREERSGRMQRGKEEAGESRSTLAAGTPGLLLTMDDIVRLPRYELVTQFKCIEGWSQIVHWAGVRMADFLEAYPPALHHGQEPKYVYMETPDGDYYTGYDLHVCRHPQTLLVTEMMGVPLTQYHGAPLRLHMPTKYGYKQIKRIGLISYTDDKPDDYWTKLGYDWYAGL
jgi:hypothetical protein